MCELSNKWNFVVVILITAFAVSFRIKFLRVLHLS